MPSLYAWLRRNPRLVDGALALLLIFPGGGIPKLTGRAAVNSLTASDPLLLVETQADYKASLNRSVDHVLELVGALLGRAVVIALFGISNTLTLSVIERARESALMRALGLTGGSCAGCC